MNDLTQQLERIIEKRKQLDALKAQSPELAEAIKLAEDYQTEYLELLDRYKPQFVPMPYPVYPAQPVYPWQQYKITMSSGTVHQLPEPTYKVIS
jgi:hypothetical protein